MVSQNDKVYLTPDLLDDDGLPNFNENPVGAREKVISQSMSMNLKVTILTRYTMQTEERHFVTGMM